jgi:hypothetical protein
MFIEKINKLKKKNLSYKMEISEIKEKFKLFENLSLEKN